MKIENSPQVLEKLNNQPISEIKEMAELSGASFLIQDGKITAVELDEKDYSNPMEEILKDAISLSYQKLNVSDQFINILIDYICENTIDLSNTSFLDFVKSLESITSSYVPNDKLYEVIIKIGEVYVQQYYPDCLNDYYLQELNVTNAIYEGDINKFKDIYNNIIEFLSSLSEQEYMNEIE